MCVCKEPHAWGGSKLVLSSAAAAELRCHGLILKVPFFVISPVPIQSRTQLRHGVVQSSVEFELNSCTV
jgi:hypothetical protein